MKRFAGCIRSLLLTLLISTSGIAQVFDATVAIPIDLGSTGGFAYSTALADLNRDGIPDLWVRDFVGDLTVWFGGEVSLIHNSPTYQTISGYASEFLVVDVNDDSIPDVVGAVSYRTGLEVLLGSSNGTLTTLPEQSVSFRSIEVECFDFSGDGKRDLVFTADSSSLVLLQGDGTGQFTEIGSFEVGGRVAGLTSGFFNSDNRVDVAIALPHDSAIAIYLGNNSAGFDFLATIPVQVPVSKLVAGDFNGDQLTDLCAADSVIQAVTFVDGDGTGLFANLHTTQLSGRPSSLFVYDFLHDGIDELTISCKVQTYDGHVALLRAEGGIMVVDSEMLPMTPSYVLGHAFVADMNSDGVEDIIASPGGYHVNLFIGKGDRKFMYTRSHYSRDYAANSLVGNFNDDPFPDLLLKYIRNNSGLDVLVNNGDGSFQVMPNITGGGSLQSPIVADFNNDLRDDVIVESYDTRSLCIFESDGTGMFSKSLIIDSGNGEPRFMISGDVNGDGNADFLEQFWLTSQDLAVREGLGTGAFLPPRIVVSNAGTPDEIVDINNDGLVDVLTRAEGNVAVCLQDTHGQFTKTVSDAGPAYVNDLAAGDFNEDGKRDVISCARGFVAGDMKSWYAAVVGNGDGSFQPPQVTYYGKAINQVVVFDGDRDGHADIALSDGIAGLLSLFRGRGDGSFHAPEVYVAGDGAFGISAADFNQDGCMDVVVSNENDTSISIMWNSQRGASSCCYGRTGNIDCDPVNIVDISDLMNLVDHLFFNFSRLCCEESANLDSTPGIDIGDLTFLVDHLFITFQPLPSCNE